jgi:molybdopterin-guanine dinucleotide biosynthesis protein MobB
MKIIQVVGRSNSGKTTFICRLVPILKVRGSVAVIKHLADHDFSLEAGRDTTCFFDAGADISIGVDRQKAVVATRSNDLDRILANLAAENLDFVVIEGFKQRPFPKIVIGELAIENCVLANPTADEAAAALHLFADFETIKQEK